MYGTTTKACSTPVRPAPVPMAIREEHHPQRRVEHEAQERVGPHGPKPEQAASAAIVIAAGGTAKATYRRGVTSSGLS